MSEESNITGCLDPDAHKGQCGYSLRNCKCGNKLRTTGEVKSDRCNDCKDKVNDFILDTIDLAWGD